MPETDARNEKTIHETLLELRAQNVLIRQANLEARQAEKARADAEVVARSKREWVNDEALKIERCTGLPAPSMRTGLRAMNREVHEETYTIARCKRLPALSMSTLLCAIMLMA